MALLICRCACLPHGLFNLLQVLGDTRGGFWTGKAAGVDGLATVIEPWPVAPLWLNRAGCCKPMSAS
jgi:hypothetical protein